MSRIFPLKFYSFLYIPLFIFLCSCGNNQTTSKTTTAASINQDSTTAFTKKKKVSATTKQLDALFKNRENTTGLNGCVLVAQRGQIIYENVFGYANIKTEDSLKINSAFQLASTSKPLTAAAILLLKDQGKLSLSDKLQKFFPGFPYPNITVQLLLTHRSGLSNYLYFAEPYCDANNCYDGKTFTNNSVLQLMMEKKPPLYAQPNRKFEYCNTNYALLALIVEKVSGVPYADFMEQNIFKPLGMTNTWVHSPKYDSLHTNKTIGHTPAGVIEKEKFADEVIGDKGVYSTVDDLFKWDQALYTEKILKKKTIEEAFTGYSNEHKGKRNYGYGWRLTDGGKDNKVVYHNGWWHGYCSLFFRRISDQTTVIILSNRFNSSIYHIEDVLGVLNKDGSKPVELDTEK